MFSFRDSTDSGWDYDLLFNDTVINRCASGFGSMGDMVDRLNSGDRVANLVRYCRSNHIALPLGYKQLFSHVFG